MIIFRKPSWPKAVAWYEKALYFLQSAETKENETPHEDVRPRYELLERMAVMYKEGMQICVTSLC